MVSEKTTSKRRFPIIAFVVILITTLVLFIGLGLQSWYSYKEIERIQERDFRLQKLIGIIIHLDEVLTMSARMGAETGDLKWERRYKRFEPQLDAAIKEAGKLTPEIFLLEAATQTDVANIKLVAMEMQAFELVRQGQNEDASALLFSEEYEEQKQIYAEGMKQITASMQSYVKDVLKEHRHHAYITFIVISLTLPSLIFAWLYVLRMMRNYIIERRTAVEELQESEAQFRSLFEQAAVGIVHVASNGNFLRVNKRFCEITGYTEQEILESAYQDITHPDDLDAQNEARKKVLDGKTSSYRIEKRYIRKDGTIIWGNLTAGVLIRKPSGEPDYFVSVLEETTERKKAEEQIRKLSHAVEHSSATVLITDTTGKIEYANPKFTQLTGYSFEEAIGKNPRILKSGRTPPEIYKELWKTIKSGNEWHGEFCNKKKNDELYWESTSISPVKDDKGVITNFIAVKEDITERKQTEEAVKKSEQQFRTLVSNIPGIVYRCKNDEHWTMKYISNSIEDLTGYSASDFIGNKIRSYTSITHRNDREMVNRIIQEGVRNKQPFVIEYRIVIKDGSIRHVYEKGQGVFNEKEELLWLDGAIFDNTERKKTEGELEKHRDHLETLVEERTKELKDSQEKLVDAERLAVLGKLSGSIAHEIRNPLATIDISALNLKRKLKDADEKTKSQINRIINQVKETTDTVQSLQDLANLEIPNKKRLDISYIIEEGIGTSQIPRSVEIIKKVVKDEFFVDIDGRQIPIVLRNILSNALHAMDNKGTIWVTVYKERDGNVNVSIKDSGPGITPENMKKIFKSFFGTKVKGFGYGLTICRAIMEKHGGTIVAQSEAGEGTTFILSFPSADTGNQAA